LTENKREKTQNTKINNKRRDIITEISEIKSILRVHFEHQYANKLKNLDEMENS